VKHGGSVLSENQGSELLAAYPVLRALPPALWRSVVFNGQRRAAIRFLHQVYLKHAL
jgi:hypothetical protein